MNQAGLENRTSALDKPYLPLQKWTTVCCRHSNKELTLTRRVSHLCRGLAAGGWLSEGCEALRGNILTETEALTLRTTS